MAIGALVYGRQSRCWGKRWQPIYRTSTRYDFLGFAE